MGIIYIKLLLGHTFSFTIRHPEILWDGFVTAEISERMEELAK